MTEGLTQRASPPPPGELFTMIIMVIVVTTVITVITVIMIIMTTSIRLAVQQVEAEKHLVMVRDKNTTRVSESEKHVFAQVQLSSNHYAFSLKRSTVTRWLFESSILNQ